MKELYIAHLEEKYSIKNKNEQKDTEVGEYPAWSRNNRTAKETGANLTKKRKKSDRITELMEQCRWGQTCVMILDLAEYKKRKLSGSF